MDWVVFEDETIISFCIIFCIDKAHHDVPVSQAGAVLDHTFASAGHRVSTHLPAVASPEMWGASRPSPSPSLFRENPLSNNISPGSTSYL